MRDMVPPSLLYEQKTTNSFGVDNNTTTQHNNKKKKKKASLCLSVWTSQQHNSRDSELRALSVFV
jgi:hypothetical protein